MMEKKNTMRQETVFSEIIIPVHLKGADEIASIFGVARETVVRWVKQGAPVKLVGKKYQANYGELWAWIKEQ